MRATSSLRGLKVFSVGCAVSQGIAHNDPSSEGNSIPSLVQQADDAVEAAKARIKTPLQFEQIKQTIGGTGSQTFDGFRCAVQKQVNLNTMVSHFFWLGSQAIGQPIYQYRLVLHDEDKVINVATDMDVNVEGEIKLPIAPKLNFKTNFTLSEQAKSGTINIDYAGDSCTGQIEISRGGGSSLGCSFVQSLTPYLSLGGSGRYFIEKGLFNSSYGGIYDAGEHMLATVWDNQLQVLYLRRVNRNRVHLASLLTVDENMRGLCTASAEFILKQSKLNLSIDSDLMIKSAIETGIAAGMQMQLAAEMQHLNNHYRFGYGLMIG